MGKVEAGVGVERHQADEGGAKKRKHGSRKEKKDAEEHRRLLDEWCMRATKSSLRSRVTVKKNGLQGPATPDNEPQETNDNPKKQRGVVSGPVAVVGKRKRGSLEREASKGRKQRRASSPSAENAGTTTSTGPVWEDCYVNKWLEATAFEPLDTSSSTDIESLMGDDFDRFDFHSSPGKNCNSDGEETAMPRVRCEFSWSKAFRHQKRSKKQLPSLTQYKAALAHLTSEASSGKKKKKGGTAAKPVENTFTGSFQKYLSDPVSPSTPKRKRKRAQCAPLEHPPETKKVGSGKSGADGSILSKSFDDFNSLLEKIVGDELVKVEYPHNSESTSDWVDGSVVFEN